LGIGSARGEDRAVQAAELAISSPLLEASIDGAYGVLLSIQGGSDLGLFEINEAARLVQEAAHPEANIIFGAVIDDALGDEVRVTVIAAGFDGGVPTKRADDRALGQITGASRPAGAAAPAPAANGAVTTNGAGTTNGAAVNGAGGHAATTGATGSSTSGSQRPYGGQQFTTAASSDLAGGPARSSDAPPVTAPGETAAADDEPFVVPDSLEPVRVGRAQRGVVFDDGEDDLDVPDFLK
jgi:cell division protein FtsZ